MSGVRSAGEADDSPARVRVPVRSAQAGKGRHEIHAAGIGNAGGELLDVDRFADEAQAVAQPLHYRAAGEDAPFQRELLRTRLRRASGDQAALGRDRLAAGVQKQEAPGAVGVLRHARLVAGLAEERRLLVAGDSGDGDFGAENVLRGRAVDMGGGKHLGKHRARHAEDSKQLLVPFAAVDVVEHGARGVARIRDVELAARELPREPRVDGAEGELAALGARAQAGDVVEQPLDLGRGEIRIDDEPGLRLNGLVPAFALQRIAARRGAPVLPDDRAVDRFPRAPVPHDRGLALIGDPDRGDAFGG